MGMFRDFLNVWLNPKKQTSCSLEDAIKKYNIPPKAAEQLLKTANGIAWTGYEEKEEMKSRINKQYKSEPKETETTIRTEKTREEDNEQER